MTIRRRRFPTRRRRRSRWDMQTFQAEENFLIEIPAGVSTAEVPGFNEANPFKFHKFVLHPFQIGTEPSSVGGGLLSSGRASPFRGQMWGGCHFQSEFALRNDVTDFAGRPAFFSIDIWTILWLAKVDQDNSVGILDAPSLTSNLDDDRDILWRRKDRLDGVDNETWSANATAFPRSPSTYANGQSRVELAKSRRRLDETRAVVLSCYVVHNIFPDAELTFGIALEWHTLGRFACRALL